MFRIELFVDDKKLAPLLLACSGLVVSMSPPQPVVNEAETDKGLKAVTNGRLSDLLYAELRRRKTTEFTPKEGKAFLSSIGRSPLSFNHVVKELCNEKHAKMLSPGHYKVLS